MAWREMSALGLCLLAMLHCGCDRDSGRVDANRLSQPQPAAISITELIGHWRVTTVEGGSELPVEMIDDLKTATLTLHDDQTFRAKNNTYGGYGGTWDVSGSTLTLTTKAEEGKVLPPTSSLAIEENRLIRRGEVLNAVYEKVPPESMVTQFRLTADAFITEQKHDPATFKSKYLGKYVELDGVVNKVITTFSQESYVLVFGPPEPGAAEPRNLMEGVACFTIEKEPFGRLAYGQSVRIRGEVSELADVAQLVEAEIVEAGPPTAVSLAAETLSREFQDDSAATVAKYSAGKFTGKTLILTGHLVSVNAESGSQCRVVLGTPVAPVQCIFGSEKVTVSHLQSLKPGAMVRVVGEFDLVPSKDRYPTVTQCRLVTGN